MRLVVEAPNKSGGSPGPSTGVNKDAGSFSLHPLIVPLIEPLMVPLVVHMLHWPQGKLDFE